MGEKRIVRSSYGEAVPKRDESVAALAADWGVTTWQVGKTVWAEIRA